MSKIKFPFKFKQHLRFAAKSNFIFFYLYLCILPLNIFLFISPPFARGISSTHTSLSNAMQLSQNQLYHDKLQAYETKYYYANSFSQLSFFISKSSSNYKITLLNDSGDPQSFHSIKQNNCIKYIPKNEKRRIFIRIANQTTSPVSYKLSIQISSNSKQKISNNTKKNPTNTPKPKKRIHPSTRKQMNIKNNSNSQSTNKIQKNPSTKRSHDNNQQSNSTNHSSKKNNHDNNLSSDSSKKNNTHNHVTNPSSNNKSKIPSTNTQQFPYLYPQFLKATVNQTLSLKLNYPSNHKLYSKKSSQVTFSNTNPSILTIKNLKIYTKRPGISIIYAKLKLNNHTTYYTSCLIRVISNT